MYKKKKKRKNYNKFSGKMELRLYRLSVFVKKLKHKINCLVGKHKLLTIEIFSCGTSKDIHYRCKYCKTNYAYHELVPFPKEGQSSLEKFDDSLKQRYNHLYEYEVK